MRVVYNIFWLYWLENASKERTILCCDTRRTACHLTAWFGIENVILADDVAIKKSTVRELNRKYNRDLVVIKGKMFHDIHKITQCYILSSIVTIY